MRSMPVAIALAILTCTAMANAQDTPTATFTATSTFTATAVFTHTPTVTNTPDPRPAISIADVSGLEGDFGTRSFNFVVTLSKKSAEFVTVVATTVDGSAVDGSDYVGRSTLLGFPPGTTTVTMTVSVIGDVVREPTLGEPTCLFVPRRRMPRRSPAADQLGLSIAVAKPVS